MIAILHRGKLAAAAMLALATLAFGQFGTATPAAAQETSKPQNGYWVNPDQPGRGFSIEIKDNKLFMGMMFFDSDNTSKWTVSSGPMTDATHYTGPMLEYRNGQALHSTYHRPDYTQIGEISLEFTSATTAKLTWPEGTVAINRMSIVPNGLSSGPAANMPQTGWYWQPAEGGRGWFFEVQGDTAYVTAYTYDINGPTGWYVSRGQMVSNAFYMGKFTAFTGGSPLGATTYSAPNDIVDGGYVTMLFPVEEQNGTATLWVGGGNVIPLIRFDFAWIIDQQQLAAAQ